MEPLQIINKVPYADAEEIAEAIGKHLKTVNTMANKGNWEFIPEKTRSRHPKKWFLISKLPEAIRNIVNAKRFETGNSNERLTREQPATIANVARPIDAGIDSLEGGALGSDKEGVSGVQLSNRDIQCGNTLGAGGSLVSGTCQLHKTTDKQREIEGARLYLLNFIERLDCKASEAVIFINQSYKDGTLHVESVFAYEHCNDKAAKKVRPLSLRSIQNWRKLKKETGSCLPKKTRVKVDWQEVWWLPLFFACYRKPQKPSQTEAHQEFETVWAKQGFQEPCPSYSAVNRLLKVVPKLVKEWGRSTGSEYKAYQSFVRRDWSGMSSNEVWVGDGHTFKAKVRHPDRENFAFAPEVTVIIDAPSRFIVGWAFSLSENQIAVSESLGKGMVKYGKPLVYYSDNGSGQTAKTLDCPAGGMLARMGVRHETGIPGNPQGRGIIEGLWDITTIAVAKTFKTFQGKGMDGGAIRKNTAAINSAKRKDEVPDIVPTWQEFIAACEARFEWYNTQHKHSSLGGKTPAEVYHTSFDDSWSCHLTDEELATLYRPSMVRKVRRGEVTFSNNIYFNRQLEELPYKTSVRVSYDLHDASKVWISDLNGVFICEALWDANKKEGFAKSMMQELKQQRKDRKQKKAMDKYNEAELEYSGNAIEGESEVLQRIPSLPKEVVEPLMRVPAMPKPVEEPPTPVAVVNFSKQEPEERTMTRLETLEWIKEQGKKNKGQ